MRRNISFRFLAPISSFVARQLSRPSGWFGGKVMVHVLNRGNRALITETLKRLEPASTSRLLDIGFGGGLSLRLARDLGVRHLVGVELSEAAVQSIQNTSSEWLRGAELTVMLGSVEKLPLDSDSIDAVVSTNTIYFWSDLARVFRELWRVLAPGGRLALGFSSNEKLRSFSTVTRHGFLFHDEQELLTQVTSAGFSDVQLMELHDGDTEGDRILIATKPR